MHVLDDAFPLSLWKSDRAMAFGTTKNWFSTLIKEDEGQQIIVLNNNKESLGTQTGQLDSLIK